MITNEAIENLEKFIKNHGKHFAARSWNTTSDRIAEVKIERIEIDFTNHKVVMAHFRVITTDGTLLPFAKAINPLDGSMDHDGYHYDSVKDFEWVQYY